MAAQKVLRSVESACWWWFSVAGSLSPSRNVRGEENEKIPWQITGERELAGHGSVFVGSRCKVSSRMQSSGGGMLSISCKHAYTSGWRL